MVEVKVLGDGYKGKDEKKKKRARRKKVKKNPNPAVGSSDFVSAVETLTKFSTTRIINCFARYFIERVFDEIRILNYQGHRPAQANKDAFYVSHKLPMWEMHLFPLYDIGNPEFHEIISLSNNKQSYLLKRIAELSPQMAMQLNKINEESEEKVIPLSAISRILSVMVHRPHGACFDAIAPSLETVDSVAKMSPAPYCDSVFIPDAIPLNQRDNLLIEVSDKIHDLLMEAFVAMMLAGWYELSVIQNLKSQGAELSTLQNPVREMACCTWLETQLSKIGSIEELDACKNREFSSFYHIYSLILFYMDDRISKIAPWYAYRLKVDDPPVEQAAYEFYTDDMEPEAEEVFRDLTHSKTDSSLQPPKKEVSQFRVTDFQSEISDLEKKKLSKMPWRKYELRGGLRNVVNFIYRSLNNCCKKIIEEEVKIIPGLDMSFRTHRRDNRKIRTGALNEFLKKINKLGTIKQVKDLSDEDLELYKKYKADRAKHHTEGYMTQNQLIEYLRDPEEIAELNKKGILLKKYSANTLKIKLKKLNDTGIIKHETDDKGTFHYKEEDKEQIAQAIANLQKCHS